MASLVSKDYWFIAWRKMPKTRSAAQVAKVEPDPSDPTAPVSPSVTADKRRLRLDGLRASILRGDYRISSEELARKLMDSMRRKKE